MSIKRGHFDFEEGGTYVIENTDGMLAPWEYIYQNRDILVKVDQNGFVSSQAYPPGDIMLFKRELNEKYSKWLVWIQSECLNGGQPVSNFGYPKTGLQSEKPRNLQIRFAPSKAIYSYDYQEISLQTEIIIPKKGVSVLMRVTAKNTGKEQQNVKIMPAFCPYINDAVLAPWDKPEWYLQSRLAKDNDCALFYTHLLNPSGDKFKRRLVSMTMPNYAKSYAISLERYNGQGSFDLPEFQFAIEDSELQPIGKEKVDHMMCGYPPVYAACYQTQLLSGEEKTYTFILSMKEQVDTLDAHYFEKKKFDSEEKNVKAFYTDLFSKRRIKTSDREFDYYVNTFLPLQMYWVASLDRGWPTGMRGVRDCANDFIGMLPIDKDWAKEILLQLCACQQADGWFPRQISTKGKLGKHDMRKYSDGGAFFLEFAWEYLCYTHDFSLLDKKVSWLNREEEDSVKEHILRAFSYYLSPQHIGEHGLCKIYEGDWLDAVNRAGVLGRGESVTVTNQVIMSLRCFGELFQSKAYLAAADTFKDNLRRHAYNKAGYFSSVFTDRGTWLFSNLDEDGKKRIYGPSNYYAILSGVADKKMTDSIMSQIENLKCEMGYRLFAPAFEGVELDGIGRIASGDMPDGLWENSNVYNHGSNGFFARALAHIGEGDKLYEVLQYLLPYNENCHPQEKTHGSPYSVVNCYQRLPMFYHRSGMPHLTGTIAMGLRCVYDWMFGIQPTLVGVRIKPCLPKDFAGGSVQTTLCGKGVTLHYVKGVTKGLTLANEEIYDGGEYTVGY